MDSIVDYSLNQLLPGLLAFLGALGWFAQRARHQLEPPPSRWWGALAGLAALAVPSVTARLIVWGIDAGQMPVLLLSLGVLVFCARQREDLFRRSFSTAVLVGVLLREGLMLVLSGIGALLALRFIGTW